MPTRSEGNDPQPLFVSTMKGGIPVPNAAVTVIDRATGGNALIYSDQLLATPVANPTTSDGGGRLQVYVRPGQYGFTITGADAVDDILIGGVAEGLKDRKVNPIGVNTLGAFSATPTWDASLGDYHTMPAATAAVTAQTITNPTVGQIITIDILQDGTGSRAITWPANLKFGTGITTGTTVAVGGPTGAAAVASKHTMVRCYWNGTNWLELARSVDVG